ncbi:MAG: protein kinase [Vicinamibacterales bacterium]
MPLPPGTRLGPYEIVSTLGVGGMGEVYRARDARLNRDVAIKVLPPALSSDPERLARFSREAQVLASLNHPNIAHIHGREDAGGTPALVMELVEGLTIAELIEQRQTAGSGLSLDVVVPIATQIAAALEAAHEQGIVHRDLKPANIKVRDDGTVKVLDFGLAKALEPIEAVSREVTGSPTITSPAMTQMGVILGTAAYMSPEQARGSRADKRSDIWAFGAVLYEMLSGARLFNTDGLSDTLAAVLRQDIDWAAIPETTPPRVRRLMARCLERDVSRRLRDIGEARIVLEDPDAVRMKAASVAAAQPRSRPWERRAIPSVLSAVLAAVLAGITVWYLTRARAPSLDVTRFTLAVPEGEPFSPAGTLRHLIALSPDGSKLVYATRSRLQLRFMSHLEVQSLPGTEGFQSVIEPAFSPDSQSLAFFAVADQTIKKIALPGGAAVTICRADHPFGISWGPDSIVFGQGSKGIMRVSPDGGTPELLAGVKDGEEAQSPQVLPGGQHVIFTLATGTARDRWDKAEIILQSLKSGVRTRLIQGGSDARYIPTGHIVYAASGILYAVAFDLQRLRVTSEAVPVVEGVRRATAGVTGAAHVDASLTGSFIYIPGPVAANPALLEIALIDLQGNVEPLKLAPGLYSTPRASPDGERIAFVTEDSKDAIVWVYDVSGATARRRLTFGGNNRFPIWSPDGTRVAFQSDRDGDLAIFSQAADGSGAAERLTKPDQGTSHVPDSWSPKGDVVLYTVVKGSQNSLWTLSLRDRKAVPFGNVRSTTEIGAVFSPDGRWVAYSSTEGGQTRVFVEPFPATGAKYQLPAEGDNPHMAVWARNGTELFYDPRAGGFESVRVTTQPVFAFGDPVPVSHPFQLGPVTARTSYDITRAGKFVGLLPAGQKEFLTPIAPQINVVLNWFEELKARVPPRK